MVEYYWHDPGCNDDTSSSGSVPILYTIGDRSTGVGSVLLLGTNRNRKRYENPRRLIPHKLVELLRSILRGHCCCGRGETAFHRLLGCTSRSRYTVGFQESSNVWNIVADST